MSTNKRWRNARKGRWLKFPALRRQPPDHVPLPCNRPDLAALRTRMRAGSPLAGCLLSGGRVSLATGGHDESSE